MNFYIILFVGLLVFINCNKNVNFLLNFEEILNSNPNRNFKYSNGEILDFHVQGDDTIKIHAKYNTDCLPNKECVPDVRYSYCDVQLIKKSPNLENQHGNVEDLSSNLQNYEIIRDSVSCKEQNFADIVLKTRRRWCTGCRVDLNVNATGIEEFIEAALKHIESESKYQQKLLQVLRIQRDTIPTIKYYLLIQIKNSTSCSQNQNSDCVDSDSDSKLNTSAICLIVFEEKPLLNANKHIVENNCTLIQNYTYNNEKSIYDNNNRDKSNEIVVSNNNGVSNGILNNMIVTNNDEANEISNFIEQTPMLKKKQSSASSQIFEKTSPNYDEIAKNGDSDAILNYALPSYATLPKPKFVENETDRIEPGGGNLTEKAIEGFLQVIQFDDPRVDKSGLVSDNKPKRRRRDLDEDEEFKLVKELADFAMKSMDKIDLDLDKRVVNKIIHFKTKVQPSTSSPTSDLVYYIIFKVGIDECGELNDFDEDINNNNNAINMTIQQSCFENKTNEQTKELICKCQILFNKQSNEKKLLKTQCFHDKNIKRRKRQVKFSKVDSNDKELIKILENILNKLDKEFDRDTYLKIIKINKSEKQNGANKQDGVIYKINVDLGFTNKILNDDLGYDERQQLSLENIENEPYIFNCEMKVWYRDWLPKVDKMDTSVMCDQGLKKSFRNRRDLRRSHKSHFVGGVENSDLNNPWLNETLENGLNLYDTNVSKSTSDYYSKIYKVQSVKNQVVAGVKVIVTAEVGDSDLVKQPKKNLTYAERNNLKEHPDYKNTLKNCTFTAWIQAWQPENNQYWVDCDDHNNDVQHHDGKKRTKRELNEDYRHFVKFMNEFNKSYTNDDEENYRFGVFKKNLQSIDVLNKNELGTGVYGVTEFTDLTHEEFKARHLGLNLKLKNENDIPLAEAEIPNVEPLPSAFDWREHNAVTKVKNQGFCGSCWAFSVTGNVEGLYAIKTGKLLEFSEQELVDCDKYDEGCSGGLPDKAYRAIEELGGLEAEDDYPYEGKNDKCHLKKAKIRVQISSGLNITTNETGMAQWLVKNGPITIGINAFAMQFYFGGVSHPAKILCNPNELDHGVVIVGYGVSTSKFWHRTMPYWIIKNSWGAHWGEHGYYRVYRGDGTCGLNQMPSSAVLDL